MKTIIASFVILLGLCCSAQDISYARFVLDTLCSENFDGRGYYNNGEKRAADFIAAEFQAAGLQKLEESFLQHFKLPVNSIKGTVKFTVDAQHMEPGVDYLIEPASPSYAGESKIIFLEKSQITDIDRFKESLKLFENKFVVIDRTLVSEEPKEVQTQVSEIIGFLKYNPQVQLNGVVELIKEKLTYTASQEVAERPHLIVLKEKFPQGSKRIEVKIENEFNKNHTSQNVVGYYPGAVRDSFICIVAHYDHLGRMGESIYFPGANDNASGIAMLLSLAKDLTKENLPYSLLFIAFGSKEIGLVGSKHFVEHPLVPLEKIKFLLNLDILGTGDDGIQVVNGTEFKTDFNWLVDYNSKNSLLKEVKIRGKACNSDHCFFFEKGVPCFFIYTLGGIAHYHNIFDRSETLPLTEYNDLFVLLKNFVINKK